MFCIGREMYEWLIFGTFEAGRPRKPEGRSPGGPHLSFFQLM
jgi:hypothetical protein